MTKEYYIDRLYDVLSLWEGDIYLRMYLKDSAPRLFFLMQDLQTEIERLDPKYIDPVTLNKENEIDCAEVDVDRAMMAMEPFDCTKKHPFIPEIELLHLNIAFLKLKVIRTQQRLSRGDLNSKPQTERLLLKKGDSNDH